MWAILDGSYWNQGSHLFYVLVWHDKLIRFHKGILLVLPNTFNTFVGMLLGSAAFLLFIHLSISWISTGSVGVRKKFDCRGSVRKSERCLLVFTILPSIFCEMVEKKLWKWLLIRSRSVSSIPSTFRQVTLLLFLLFIFASNLIPPKVLSMFFVWSVK